MRQTPRRRSAVRAASWWLIFMLAASLWAAPLAGAGPEEPPAEEAQAEQTAEPEEPQEEEGPSQSSDGGSKAAGGAEVEEITAEHVPGEVIVKYRSGVGGAKRDQVLARVGARRLERLSLPRVELVRAARGDTVAETIAELESRPEVEYAEPNYIVHTTDQVIPDDLRFEELWGLHNIGQPPFHGTPDADIDTPEAWTVSTGSTDVVVGVVDTGVQGSHPDLQGNFDSRGKSYVGGSAYSDPNGHGTHVAGTIGARGNNPKGVVVGVSWRLSIMPLRVLDKYGTGSIADVAAAFDYAGGEQADIVNASLGARMSEPKVMADAIQAHPGTLFVFAAGNDGRNNDTTGFYPCNHQFPNVICVAASNKNDARPSFSNYGSTKVHLAAPGVEILSTWKGSKYKKLSGTSMATPHVAGVAALVKAASPAASVADVKATILDSVDPVSWGSKTTATGGRLNAARALGLEPDPDLIAAITPTMAAMPRYQGDTSFEVAWSTWGDADSYDVRYRQARWDKSFGSHREVDLTAANATDLDFSSRPGFTYCFSARGRDEEDNVSHWTREACTSSPLNNGSLTHRGSWVRRNKSGHYLNTFSRSRKRGSRLVRTDVRAKRLAIVATKCPKCGVVDVFWNKKRLKRINLRASSRRPARIIGVASFSKVRKGRVRIRVVSSGKPVLIEGLGISKV